MDNETDPTTQAPKFTPVDPDQYFGPGQFLDRSPEELAKMFVIPIDVAAERCGVSTKWIREAIKKGKLRYVKEPRGQLWQYLTSIEALNEWQGRGKAIPGRGKSRSQYELHVPTDSVFEMWLIASIEKWIKTNPLFVDNVILRRGKKILIGGQNATDTDDVE